MTTYPHAPEMHWSRWGNPAEAGPLADSAFAPADVRLTDPLDGDLLDELAAIVGPENVLTDHDSRLHRTRGKSTPDMLKIRRGDGSDSPDAVVRPGDHAQVVALIDWCVRRHV